MSSKISLSLSQTNAVSLYRQLLKYSRELKYTNKDFYIRQIQAEFRKHQFETDQKICKQQYNVS